MKPLLILLALINFAYGQQKKDNTIIAKNVSFDSAVIRLMDLGYHIQRIDKDYKTAETDIGKYDVVIFIRQKGPDLYITGEIRSMGLKIPIEYGWGSKKRWETLMGYASVYPEIVYYKDPTFSAEGQN